MKIKKNFLKWNSNNSNIMINPNPECPRDDCMYLQGGGQSTLAYYPSIYDKNGVNTNPDRNITTFTLKCLTCDKMWKCASQLGLTTYEEVLENQEKFECEFLNELQ